MKKKPAKNILERFSCFLVGGGKKISGHKILMESLFCLRQNNNHTTSSKNLFEKDKNFGLQNKVTPVGLQNLTERKEAFQHKEKIIRQFLSLPFKNTRQKLIMDKKGQQYNQIIKPAANNYENNSELFVIKRLLNKNLCFDSIENAKPILETRKIRKGRVTYKVPKVTSSIRQEGKAISLLIENANLRKKNQLKRSLSFIGDGSQSKVLLQNNTIDPSVQMTSFDYDAQTKHYGDAKQSAQKEKTQNRVDFLLPFLFSSQIFPAAGQSSVKTSFNSALNSIFLIMPSGDQSFDKKNNSITQEIELELSKKNIAMPYSTSKIEQDATSYMKKHCVDKNLFFLVKEKKDLLPNIQKPNIKYCLSEEFFDSANGKGGSIEKKKQLHNIALQNRAYQHFRWW